jgi:hypothetical protein
MKKLDEMNKMEKIDEINENDEDFLNIDKIF